MGPRESEVREEMARDADMARGLGGSGLPSLADMRYYGEELSWAALDDSMRMACGHSSYGGYGRCHVCGYEEDWLRQEREEYRRLDAEILAALNVAELALPLQSRCRSDGWMWM